ncbi:MAG: HPF/RaiA family ribosome-associated protein [Gammaproteobacteria bacterium]|nr:HPF/RaiA family ribosome-associated protein [Gammaproteobacteria bacterium]
MQSPVQITFRGFEHSDFVEEKIREKAKKLDHYYPHISHCRVVIEAEHHRHHQGNLYDVRIDITVPDKEIVVSRKKHDNHAHEDAYVAIRDAFNAARRQLEDYARVHRGDVKSHEISSRGSQAKRSFPED